MLLFLSASVIAAIAAIAAVAAGVAAAVVAVIAAVAAIWVGWYWSVLGDTGSKQGGISCQCDILSENIWLHGLNHQIIEYLVNRGRYWLVLGVTGSEQYH